MCLGSGSCTRMPCTAASAFSRSMSVEQLLLRRSWRAGRTTANACLHRRSSCACCARRSAMPRFRRPARPQVPAEACLRRSRSRTRAATSAVICAARALPSMMRAPIVTPEKMRGFYPICSIGQRLLCGEGGKRRVRIDGDRMGDLRQQRNVVARVAVEPALLKVVEAPLARPRARRPVDRSCPRACSAMPADLAGKAPVAHLRFGGDHMLETEFLARSARPEIGSPQWSSRRGVRRRRVARPACANRPGSPEGFSRAGTPRARTRADRRGGLPASKDRTR